MYSARWKLLRIPCTLHSDTYSTVCLESTREDPSISRGFPSRSRPRSLPRSPSGLLRNGRLSRCSIIDRISPTGPLNVSIISDLNNHYLPFDLVIEMEGNISYNRVLWTRHMSNLLQALTRPSLKVHIDYYILQLFTFIMHLHRNDNNAKNLIQVRLTQIPI